jgi:capsular polysaccharide transport system permease protein
MTAFDANRALLTYPIIKDVDTLIARALLISTTYIVIMVIFYTTLILFGLAQWPTHPEHLILAFLATALLGLGFGTLNAVIISLWDTWAQIEKVLTRPLFFISAIFYVPSQLPPQAREVLQWNPVLHLVEWFRHGFYPNYNSMLLDVWYPVGIGAGMLLLGLLGERLFRTARY